MSPRRRLVEKLTEEDLEDGELVQKTGDILAGCVKKKCEAISSKSKCEKYMMNVNLFMVSYVLPGILEVASRRVGKPFADGMLVMLKCIFDLFPLLMNVIICLITFRPVAVELGDGILQS